MMMMMICCYVVHLCCFELVRSVDADCIGDRQQLKKMLCLASKQGEKPLIQPGNEGEREKKEKLLDHFCQELRLLKLVCIF